VSVLLNAGADPNIASPQADSCVALDAIIQGAQLLIEKGADCQRSRFSELEPTARAANRGHAEIVELLLKNNASVNAVTKDGLTPLHLASLVGSVESVSLLLQNGAKSMQ